MSVCVREAVGQGGGGKKNSVLYFFSFWRGSKVFVAGFVTCAVLLIKLERESVLTVVSGPNSEKASSQRSR